MIHAHTPHPGRVLALVAMITLGAPLARPGEAAEPPEYFQRLIDRGNVTLEFYEPGQGPRDHSAFATFEFYVRHNCAFRINWTDRGQVRFVTIRPTVRDVKYELTNKVLLAKRLNSDARWGHWLVRHEFDHVAITLDPRLRMLIESLYGDLDRVDRRVAVGTLVDENWVLGILEVEYAKPRDAVIDLLTANENLLDEVTRHGARPIPDRQEFFRELFTQSNLRRMDFPFVDEVADLLRSRAYRQADLPYAMGDRDR